MKRILIVEDDMSIANLVKTYASLVDYESTIASDGEIALEILKEDKFDIVILDLMLPVIDGETVLEHIKYMDIPVIILSARSSLSDRVKLLRKRADDYITKPFECADLMARVEAVLRRYTKKKTFVFKDIVVDDNLHRVTKNHKLVELTPKEYDLLVYLMENKNTVLTRTAILNAVWGYSEKCGTRTVDIHVLRIRKKLSITNELKTVVKMGYILEDGKAEL